MVRILQPLRVTYATVSLPSVLTTLLSSVSIATYFLESSFKQPFQRKYIDLAVSIVIYKYWLFVYYKLLHMELPFSPTLWRLKQQLQGGYVVCVISFRGTLLYHLLLQIVSNENLQSLCHVIFTSLPTLNKCAIITTVILSVIIEYRSATSGSLKAEIALPRSFDLLIAEFEQAFI